jgi:hypothetical protein
MPRIGERLPFELTWREQLELESMDRLDTRQAARPQGEVRSPEADGRRDKEEPPPQR